MEEKRMNVLEAIRQRREITRYQQRPVEREVLAQLLDAAYLSPTGNNLPSREFILVTDKNMLEYLSQSTPFVPWLKEAAAAIAVTARPDVSKYWLQDASIACGFIWLAAVGLGLGAAFGAIYHAEDAEESARRETYVRNALSIPADRRVVAILGLGYPDQQPAPKEPLPREEIIHLERFRTPAPER
jgi:nitroreductase